MTCLNCEAILPDGALFCGECGRAVAAPVAAPVRRFIESPPEAPTGDLQRASEWTSDLPTTIDRPTMSDVPTEAEAEADAPSSPCEQCGSEMSATDIFCGECGHVSRSVSSAFTSTRDTVAVEQIVPQTPLPGGPPTAAVATSDRADEDLADIEATRIVSGRGPGERFILQFSTGESVSVFGTGLIGRNPIAEPGEYFDQLVRVLDPTRSVSKTHLEFGQEGGAFWVRDRFSGNGTVVREPERAPFRCDSGKRYLVARGSRVDVGEQFFVVS